MPFDTPAQHFIFSTVRIEASGPSGISTGTAFGFNHVLEKGIATFFVTNKHVMEEATDGTFFFYPRCWRETGTRAGAGQPDQHHCLQLCSWLAWAPRPRGAHRGHVDRRDHDRSHRVWKSALLPTATFRDASHE